MAPTRLPPGNDLKGTVGSIMIQIPIYNMAGDTAGNYDLDEQLLGGEVHPVLLKQAFVRGHANRRQGSAKNKNRGEVEGSTRKLYKQKGTGNARRGSIRANILRGGGRGHSKKLRSFRQDMPIKMRRLANRNAILAKAVDGEIKLVDAIAFDQPSTKQFASLMASLGINRGCLVALGDVRTAVARSARNIDDATITQIDRLDVYSLLNHRFLLAEASAFRHYIDRVTGNGEVTAQQVDQHVETQAARTTDSVEETA